MNQEPQPTPPEPNARRSSGVFLIIFLLAIVALVVFGNSPSAKPRSLDQLWVDLYTGQVEELKVNESGTTFEAKVGGKSFKVPVIDGRTLFASINEMMSKSQSMAPAQPLESFLRDLDNGIKKPVRGYPVRITRLSLPDDPKSPTVSEQRFFAEWADKSGGHYAEIEGSMQDDSELDIGRLIAAFRENGGSIEEGLVFNTANSLTTQPTSGLMAVFLTFGPIVLMIVLFWFLFMRQMKGQGQGILGFGRSRAQIWNKEKKTGVTFADVAGIEEALEEVGEITEFLKNPDKFTRLGGRIPRGVLLVGPPGTGKTLLAKAIAGEADVPFISISGSDFVEMFVGVGASRVRDLFEQARKEAPCIIFLDEIDAVGRKRGTGMGGGNDEREQTLNAILVEMDGFSTDDRIIVCAATNRPDVLDPALLRPGRFDREIVLNLPDVGGREKILRVHTRTIKLDPSVDLLDIARGTPGFSGAELAALCNEAAIIAAMREHNWVTQADLEEARDKVRFGRQKKSQIMEKEDKRITAYHEAGHAVVNAFMKHTDPVHKVTIIPRGMALGATMFLPEKDRMHWSRNRLLDEICVLYGGRSAEELFCEDITTGASNDIERATSLSRRMITHWGMSQKLGPVNFGERTGNDFLGNEYGMGREHSNQTQREIDQEAGETLAAQHERARGILEAHRDLVERVTSALLLYETISKEEFKALVEGSKFETLRRDGYDPEQSQRKTPPPLPTARVAPATPAPEARGGLA
jgi:cell division protease FtsH